MIHDKLLAFQQLDIGVEKDGSNPHFNKSYTTLNEVLNKIKAPLSALKVVIIQLPEKEGLRTILYDTEDKTFVESFLPYSETTNSQRLGSSITYDRRYSLTTMLNLEEEDDDGNASSGLPAKPPVRKPAVRTKKSLPAVDTSRPPFGPGSVDDVLNQPD